VGTGKETAAPVVPRFGQAARGLCVWAAAGTRVDYSEQLLPFDPLPIPNIIPVIKFGTNST
jgi:hypothetical protein